MLEIVGIAVITRWRYVAIRVIYWSIVGNNTLVPEISILIYVNEKV